MTNDVFGQIVAIGPAIEVDQIADLEVEGLSVKFRNASDTVVAPGSLVSLPDPLVRDVVLIEDMLFASDPVSGMVLRYNGRRLPASSSVLKQSN